jgi:hypothetical protein
LTAAGLLLATSDPANVPRHVAVVMDGNGRWARKRFMPRFFGHEQGMETLLRVIDLFADRGVEYLTVFAFSSENWKRGGDRAGQGRHRQVPAQAGDPGRAHPHRGRSQWRLRQAACRLG